jgi:molecular chaperone DnaJ
MKDYWEILGVPKNASKDEIKKAFRTLAKKYHPDQNPGDASAEERFKEINEAYQTLSDDEKRARYDAMRNARERGFGGFEGMRGFEDLFRQGGGAKASAGGRGGRQNFSFENLGSFRDLFGSLFDPGGSFGYEGYGQQSTMTRGRDRTFTIEVPFEVAVKGGTSSIRLPRGQTCDACGGSGADPSTPPEPCASCGGTGRIQFAQGTFAFARPCPACFGRGTKISKPCGVCGGSGQRETPRTLQVKIPQGVKDGAAIRLRGEGDPGAGGGPPGDLFLRLKILPPPGLKFQGRDLASEETVPLSTLALGGSLEVKTTRGSVKLKIPPGTQPGAVLRLRGQGAAKEDGTPGDHLVTLKASLPASLSDEQRALFERLRASGL